MVIAFSAGCFIYYSIIILKEKQKNRFIILISIFTCIILTTLILSTQNRVSNRFLEIRSGEVGIIKHNNFDPGIYFNGLQFRLLQGRFVKEILSEQNAWLSGVSAEAQKLLDKKYISTNMYIGYKNTTDHGYLGYNTHNQFLESLLQSGIIGLVSFILICLAMIRLATGRKNRVLTITVMILIAYSLNEAVFETQYGITLFTFFPLFLYYGIQNRIKG